MFLTIHFILLLLALGSSSHSLSKIQINNGSDIYQIRVKPNNVFEIIEPKAKVPTLREIIYFKIKETPYKNRLKKEKLPQEKESDFDNKQGPYTEDPDFQFLDFGPMEEHKSSEDDKNSKNNSNESKNDSSERSPGSNESNNDSGDSSDSNSDSNEHSPDSHESNNDGGGNSDSDTNASHPDSHESNNDSDESQIEKESNNNDNKSSNENKNESHENQLDSNKGETDNNSESTADSDKSKDGSSDAPKQDDNHDKDENKENNNEDTSKTLDGEKDENKNINEKNDNITPDVSQSTKPAEDVNKIRAVIQERNKKNDGANKKYHEINRKTDNSTKLERRKRNIDFSMPPPPVLQPLNVRMLPDFLQRMITNIPALKNVMSPDERGDSNYLDENGPQTYDFNLNDKGPVWNNSPFVNQGNYINDPRNMINGEKQEEYQENPDSSNDASNSGTDDNYLYSDNDSGYNGEPDDETDKSSDDNLIGGVWPNIGAPIIDFNNFKPYNPIIKENDLNKYVNKINKDAEIIERPKIELTTETNTNLHQEENRYKKSTEKEPKKTSTYTPPTKTKININKDLKEKIEMSFDNIGKIVPPMITRFQENLVKTVSNDEAPVTYGMKLSGDNGYVWNDLADPGNHYLFGETLETNKEWDKPSSPATDKFNEYNTEPTSAYERPPDANESQLHKDEGTTPGVTGSSDENQTKKPETGSGNLSEPNKENLDKDKDKSDEAVEVALDDLLKKDEFWKWLTKWTAAYISVLNEHVEEIVKREVAKQINKTMSEKNEKEKDKIDTNNNDLINKNATIANVTIVEPANNTNNINSNITTGEKNITKVNNTETIAPEKDKININKTVSDGHKSNRTTPANAHTIYGNAVDSNHVTNIFIFYPNAGNNSTSKDIEEILGNKNNNVVVLGKPSNDNTESKAPDSSTNSPVDYTKGIYAIDPKKDIVSNASEQTIQAPEDNKSNQSSTADIPATTKNEKTTDTIKANTSNNTEASTSNNTDLNANATTVDNGTNVDNGTTVDNGTKVDNGTIVDNGTKVDNGTAVDNGTKVDNGTNVDNGATVAGNSDATNSTSADNTKATDITASTTLAPDTSTASK